MKHAILDALPAPLSYEAQTALRVITLDPGQVVFRAGDHCDGLPLVVSGTIKVQMTGGAGNQIVLYRLRGDDICTLSIGCLMTGNGYRAEAFVEETAQAIMVPETLFNRMMDGSAAFRAGIMASYGRRLDDLMLLVEEVAFRRMDERLNEWLATRALGSFITITHEELAVELGTAREVVSRLLKELEKQGRVVLGRGYIKYLSN